MSRPVHPNWLQTDRPPIEFAAAAARRRRRRSLPPAPSVSLPDVWITLTLAREDQRSRDDLGFGHVCLRDGVPIFELATRHGGGPDDPKNWRARPIPPETFRAIAALFGFGAGGGAGDDVPPRAATDRQIEPEAIALLDRVCAVLSPSEAALLRLVVIERRSFPAAADLLGVDVATARVRWEVLYGLLSRALEVRP